MIETLDKTFTKGEILYWRIEPKAKFKFVKMNKDGSVQMVGGESGYSIGRDAYLRDVSTVPFDGVEQIRYWATKNIFTEVTVNELAEKFGLTVAVVRKYVTDRPDVFRRIGHGRYEVRDAEEDRRSARTREEPTAKIVKRKAS